MPLAVPNANFGKYWSILKNSFTVGFSSKFATNHQCYYLYTYLCVMRNMVKAHHMAPGPKGTCPIARSQCRESSHLSVHCNE